MIVIVGRDEREAALGRKPAPDLLARIREAIIGDDFRTITARRRLFDLRRVIRHDYDDGGSEQAPGAGERLAVIARREGNHTPPPLLGRQRRDCIVGPAKLERACVCQAN